MVRSLLALALLFGASSVRDTDSRMEVTSGHFVNTKSRFAAKAKIFQSLQNMDDAIQQILQENEELKADFQRLSLENQELESKLKAGVNMQAIHSVKVRDHHLQDRAQEHIADDVTSLSKEATKDIYAWDVQRFLIAQENPMDLSDCMIATQPYARALQELQTGAKLGHWVWYVFPSAAFHLTLPGKPRMELGSPTNKFFSLRSLPEIKAYIDNPTLRSRLMEAWDAVLSASTEKYTLGPVGTLMDGARLDWYHEQSEKAAEYKAMDDATFLDTVSKDGETKPFVGDRSKFYGHLLLFQTQSDILRQSGNSNQHIYEAVYAKVSQVMAKAQPENLDPAGVVAATAPDPAFWKVSPSEEENAAFEALRRQAMDAMNSGTWSDKDNKEPNLAVPQNGWKFLPASETAGYQKGPKECKAWCQQLKRITGGF